MRLSALLLLPLPLTLGEQLVISFVQEAVAKELARFSEYTAYDGPTGTAAAALAATSAAQVAAPKAKVNALAAPAAVTAPYPYWYETITHQGKAAFNSNTGYTVFRNVKSYGAKG